jgi:hypothetical protein
MGTIESLPKEEEEEEVTVPPTTRITGRTCRREREREREFSFVVVSNFLLFSSFFDFKKRRELFFSYPSPQKER